jgi:His/Glu/Gln/Arg/opine family amino acid ABC transporter permease subunit
MSSRQRRNSCAAADEAGMSELISWLAILAGGLLVTVELVVFTALFTIMLSAVLAICSLSPWRLVRALAGLYVDLMRSIPLLALLMFLDYGLGRIAAGLGVSAFWLVVAGLTMSESAYLGEIYRGGLLAIPESQWEAAASLGLRWPSIVGRVVLPQALPAAIPSTLNLLIGIIKDSSLASLVAVGEVTLVATILVSQTFEPMQVYLVLALLYLILIVPLSLLARWVEARVGSGFGSATDSRGPMDPHAASLRAA